MGGTLKSIAEELNLSKTTVSFVLSGKGDEMGISELTQKRILEYARSHNYEPNLLAKSLSSGISNTIGLIIPSINDMFYSQIAQEVEISAKKQGYMVIICTSERDRTQEIKMIRTLRSKRVDGLIMAPTEHCEKELKKLLSDKFPFVLIDRFFPDLESNCIAIDDLRASVGLVRHLVSKGKRKIALITTDANVSAINMRTDGYKEGLALEGIGFDKRLLCVVKRSDYANDLVKVLDRLFAEVPDVDAFFFSAHYLAMETAAYFFKRGMDLTGYGLACIHFSPALTAFMPGMNIARIPVEDIGKMAVDIVLDDFRNECAAPPEKIILDAEMMFY